MTAGGIRSVELYKQRGILKGKPSRRRERKGEGSGKGNFLFRFLRWIG
jgi:hypothetical protein